jgi:tetratricopeptide (TPR) repeat protein
MLNGRIRTVLVGAFALALAAPAAARADGSPGPDKDRARQLRAKAEALFDKPSEWRRAARLLEESAALRTADDAEAYDCLLYAGRIRASFGDYGVATRLLQRAAEHALARGVVMDAAQAYVDAAFAAKADKNIASAAELLERARLLTGSPTLSEGERVALLSRID